MCFSCVIAGVFKAIMDAAGAQVADECAQYGMLKQTIFLIILYVVVILSENLKVDLLFSTLMT